MRVYEKAKELGIEPEDIIEYLEGEGIEKRAVSGLSDEEAAMVDAHFSQVLPAPSQEEREHPGTGEEMNPVPAEADGSETELVAEPAPMPTSNVFQRVDNTGKPNGTIAVPGNSAALVAELLAGRPICAHNVYPERGEFVFVAWPDVQKFTVPA